MSDEIKLNYIQDIEIPTERGSDFGTRGISAFGQIKNWKAGSGDKSIRVDVGQGFWIGAEKFGNAGFSVDMGGNGIFHSLYTNSANGLTVDYGGDILLKHGGDVEFTSVSAPGACSAALAGLGAGNLSNGDYSYKITFVNASGETELGTASNTVTVSDNTTDGQVSLTSIPVSTSSSVTARKIYRTKVGGTDYYYLDTINDNTTTTYIDNIADTSLGSDAIYIKENNSFGKIILDSKVGLSIGISTLALGRNALYSYNYETATTETANIGIGTEALYSLSNGYHNIIIGYQAGKSITGDENVSVGFQSLYLLTSGIRNTAVGNYSLHSTTGEENTAIGAFALPYYQNSYATAVGAYALDSNTTGDNNTAIGYKSSFNIDVGEYNVAVGYQSLYADTGGSYNTIVGYEAAKGATNATANQNTIVGAQALYSYVTGGYNTAVGFQAGYNSNGDQNVFIGFTAGYYETGSNKLFIDNQSRASEADARVKALIYGMFDASTANQLLRFNSTVVIGGDAALATSATDEFLYIPTMAGAPTGTPTAYTGKVPIVYDTTDDKLYVYNGAWKSVALS